MKQASTKKYIYCALLCATAITIFILSGQPGEVSQKLSEAVADTVDIAQTNEYLSKSATPIFAGLSLRKYAHVLVYALLGLFSFLSVKQFQIRRCWVALISILGCYLYGCLDEIHQIFIPGRTARFSDTLVDAIGFVPMILILSMICLMIQECKRESDTHRKLEDKRQRW